MRLRHPNATETAENRSVSLSPNRYGTIFIITLVAMTAGAGNYNSNMAFAFTFLLGAIVLVSLGYTYRNLSGIQIRSISAQGVFAGENAKFVLHVHNPGNLKYSVKFELSREAYLVENLPENDSRIHIEIKRPVRGILRFRMLTIQTTYPLGLLQAKKRIPVDTACVVYPCPAYGFPLPSETAGTGAAHKKMKQVPGADDFHELKTYQPGDSPRHISWKAYSGGQGLFTKTFVAAAGASIIADWHQIKEADTEAKLSRLCGMIMKAHRTGLRYGLKLPGKSIAPAIGKAHLHSCLKQLAIYGIADDFDAY